MKKNYSEYREEVLYGTFMIEMRKGTFMAELGSWLSKTKRKLFKQKNKIKLEINHATINIENGQIFESTFPKVRKSFLYKKVRRKKNYLEFWKLTKIGHIILIPVLNDLMFNHLGRWYAWKQCIGYLLVVLGKYFFNKTYKNPFGKNHNWCSEEHYDFLIDSRMPIRYKNLLRNINRNEFTPLDLANIMFDNPELFKLVAIKNYNSQTIKYMSDELKKHVLV